MKTNYLLNLLLGAALVIAILYAYSLLARQSLNHPSSVEHSLERLQSLDEESKELADSLDGGDLESLVDKVYLLEEEFSRLRFELIFEAVNSDSELSNATDLLKQAIEVKVAAVDELSDEPGTNQVALARFSAASLEDSLSNIESQYETYQTGLNESQNTAFWLSGIAAFLFLLSLGWTAIRMHKNLAEAHNKAASFENQLRLKADELRIAEDLYAHQKQSQEKDTPALLNINQNQLQQTLTDLASSLESRNVSKQAISELINQLHHAVTADQRDKEQLSKTLKKLVKFYATSSFDDVVAADHKLASTLKTLV